MPWRERIEGGDVAAIFLLYVVLSAFAIGILLGPGSGLPLLAVGGSAAAVSSVWLVVRSSSKVSAESIGLKPVSVRWLLIGAGFGVLGWFASVAVGEIYFRIFGDLGNPRPDFADAVGRSSSLELVLLALAASTLVPFAEELLYRGVLYTYLRRWGIVVAIAGSAAAFGVGHGISVVTLSTAAVGVLCALAYELSGSLWPAVAAHAAMNATVSVVGLISP